MLDLLLPNIDRINRLKARHLLDINLLNDNTLVLLTYIISFFELTFINFLFEYWDENGVGQYATFSLGKVLLGAS